MDNTTKKPFWDDDTRALPHRPKSQQPMSPRHKLWAMMGSVAVAVGIHTTISRSLLEKKTEDIASLQDLAGEQGRPVVVTETTKTIRNQITEVITGKKEPNNTLIINPPGQEPPITVITPEATIIADKEGETKEVIPHTEEGATSPKDAQQTVDEALKDAAEKTLPKEESVTPLTPKKD